MCRSELRREPSDDPSFSLVSTRSRAANRSTTYCVYNESVSDEFPRSNSTQGFLLLKGSHAGERRVIRKQNALLCWLCFGARVAWTSPSLSFYGNPPTVQSRVEARDGLRARHVLPGCSRPPKRPTSATGCRSCQCVLASHRHFRKPSSAAASGNASTLCRPPSPFSRAATTA